VTTREWVVVDTNVLVSRLLLPESTSGRAVRSAVDRGRLLVSAATMEELAEVLARAKFDPYLSIAERQEFIRLLGRIAEMVPVVRVVRACRDPRDDKFLRSPSTVAPISSSRAIATYSRSIPSWASPS
jgi:uncharacterized protein